MTATATRVETACAAHLEILERHDGEKYDARTPITPNLVRVNGIPLWCSAKSPITIEVDGCEPGALVVGVRLQLRALRLGGEPTGVAPAPPAAAGERPRFARVEVPGLTGDAQAGDKVEAPYVVVEGHRLLVKGPVQVSEVFADGSLVEVDVPLLCRTVVFDDEVPEPGTTAE